MIEAKFLFQNDKLEDAVSLLEKGFKDYSDGNITSTMIKIIVNDIHDIDFRSSMDWNELTALTIYHTALLILRNKIKSYGIKSVYKAINVSDLISEIKKHPK